MKKYKLAQQAKEDLLVIFETGIENWGMEQAQKYANELHVCFNNLAAHPDIGITRAEFKEQPKSFVKGSHVIFYRYVDGSVEIATIVHQSRDMRSMFTL